MQKRVCIVGAGKLGLSVLRLMQNSDKIKATNIVDLRSKDECIKANENLKDLLSKIEFDSCVTTKLSKCDIIIDCTVRDAFASNINVYEELKKPLVIATTNIEDFMPKVIELSKYVPIIREPNYDFGLINFRSLLKGIRQTFDYMNFSVIEVHHTQKIDASGTGKSIIYDLSKLPTNDKKIKITSKIISSNMYVQLENENIILKYSILESNEKKLIEIFQKYFSTFEKDAAINEPSFENSKKFDNDYEGINMISIREGNVVGTHTIIFKCEATNETIEVTHEVKSRDVFADGIVKVANSLNDYENGMHGIKEFVYETDMSFLQDVFIENKKLDSVFNDDYDNSVLDIIKKNILGLIVEIGEFCNETKCFKYWSNKPVDRDASLEEFADCITMILCLFNLREIELNERFKQIDNSDLTLAFIELFNISSSLTPSLDRQTLKDILSHLVHVSELLEYTKGEIIEACLKKVSKNFARFDSKEFGKTK